MPKHLRNRDCSTDTGADLRIARQEQGESTRDPLHESELAPDSVNGSIPSLTAWTVPKPPGNAATVSKNLGKVVLAANGAFVVRSLRFGLKDATTRLASSFRQIDPFYPAPLAAIKEVKVADLVESLPVVKIDSKYVDVVGSLPLHELFQLLVLLRSGNPQAVLEIGTFLGSTTKNMALNLPEGTVNTVDLPEDVSQDDLSRPVARMDDFHLIAKRKVGQAFRSDESVDNVRQHYADTAAWDFLVPGPRHRASSLSTGHTPMTTSGMTPSNTSGWPPTSPQSSGTIVTRPTRESFVGFRR